MYDSSRAIYWSMGMSLVYCLLFIYLMSAFAECISWGIIILVQLGLIGASLAGFALWVQRKNDGLEGAGNMLTLGIIFALLACIFMILLYCGY